MEGKRGRLQDEKDDSYNNSPIPYIGMLFADWFGEKRELEKAGGTDEAKEEKDTLMQHKKAFVDLSQSHILEKENEFCQCPLKVFREMLRQNWSDKT